jgi:hypothetical protein
MRYFYIEPEVAGSSEGPNSVMDRSVHPPIVSRLHYVFAGWSGDVLLESFPAFIVTEDAMNKLMESGATTGARFADVKITTTYPFRELHPDTKLPKFTWLQVTGREGRDDFGLAADLRLVISERALDVLKGLQLTDALIEPFGK